MAESVAFTTEQIWLKGEGAAGQTWTVPVTGIPDGATIKSVVLSFANGHTYNDPGRSSIYWGTSNSGTRIWTTSGSLGGASEAVDLTSRIAGNGNYSLYFYKSANSGSTSSNVYFSSPKVTITYEKPVGAIKRVENGELVSYTLYHAEGGELVRYDIARTENGELTDY